MNFPFNFILFTALYIYHCNNAQKKYFTRIIKFIRLALSRSLLIVCCSYYTASKTFTARISLWTMRSFGFYRKFRLLLQIDYDLWSRENILRDARFRFLKFPLRKYEFRNWKYLLVSFIKWTWARKGTVWENISVG